MNARKKSIPLLYILIGASVFMVLLAIGIITYQKIKPTLTGDTPPDIPVNLYFYNPQTAELEAEKRNIPYANKTEIMKSVLNEWLKGPNSANLTLPLTSEVEILEGIIKDNDVAELQFSKTYHDLTTTDELRLRSALVWTLTELDFIDDVYFLVEGDEKLPPTQGDPTPANRDNMPITRPVLDPPVEEKTIITLYFPDSQGEFLIPETREVTLNQTPSLALEKKLMEELIKGPTDTNLVSMLPKDISILEIGLSEGVCDIDFNKEFETKFQGGSTAEIMLIYSIVNTLTESPNVQKVQILLEGNKISIDENTKFQMDLSKPLERNDDLIKK